MRVLELYSGIGGFHYALEECGLPSEVVAAADINNVANAIYSHNFPGTKILQRSIESLSVREMDKLSPDLVHMSPPCQPFVRVGKQQDAGDVRTKSFLHLIHILPQLRKQPCYIFLENVKGFDTSETRRVLVDMLQEQGYIYQEFLLSPLQFGIPNSRLRYYLLAKLHPAQFGFTIQEQIRQEMPSCAEPFLVHRLTGNHSNQTECTGNHSNQAECTGNHSNQAECTGNHSNQAECTGNHSNQVECTGNHSNQTEHIGNHGSDTERSPDSSSYKKDSLSDSSQETTRLDSCSQCGDSSNSSALVEKSISNQSKVGNVPCDSNRDEAQSELIKEPEPLYKRCQDICRPVGDYLVQGTDEYFNQFLVSDKFLPRFWSMDIVRSHNKNSCCFTKRYAHHIEGAGSVIQMAEPPSGNLVCFKEDRTYNESHIKALRLRFFTPREIANLMCFPPHFNFPPDVGTIQCYRVLGNSLNVHVVAVLLRLLVMGDDLS